MNVNLSRVQKLAWASAKWLVLALLAAFLVYRMKFAPLAVMAHRVASGPVVAEVMGTGTLEARVKTTISPRIQERLAEVLVDQGDPVKSGQLLARLDDGELKMQVEVAEAARVAARASLERVKTDEARAVAVSQQARLDYKRISDLLTNQISSQADFDKAVEQVHVAEADVKRSDAAIGEAESQLVTAEKNLLYQRERLGFTRIESPYDGLIVRRDRDPGGVVVPGSSILQLISTNEIWVSAWVDETAGARLAAGQPARVVFRSEPGKSYPGEVARLGRETDRETREFLADVRPKTLPKNWTVGQRAEVYVETGRKESTLALPLRFMSWRGGKSGAFVIERGKAMWREVKLGLRGLETAEVAEGLAAGQVVCKPREAKQPLTDGQRVTVPRDYAMNLAAQDIRHNVGRFLLTALGIGLLLMLVLGMGGVYQGLVFEATQLVDDIGADLWVVQKSTRGPFAEVSRIPVNLEFRLLAVPGVQSAKSFVAHTIQREHRGKPLRMFVEGLDWPEDKGEWLRLTAGRPLAQGHYEMIADQILGLELGDRVPLGKDVYTVVGLTKGMASSSGDGMAFFTVRDALALQFDVAGESARLERAARRSRAGNQDFGRVQPELLERAAGPSSALPALATPLVSAILVKVAPGADVASVMSTVSAWPDVTAYTHEGQRQLLLRGNVDRARRQLGLFRVILVIVSTIIMALIIYTLTLDKTHDIAMLKLMGARNRVIVGLILQQALLLGALGYGVAYYIGHWLYPLFPRRVMITGDDLWILAGIVVAISSLASLLGIAKALRVEPNKVLS